MSTVSTEKLPVARRGTGRPLELTLENHPELAGERVAVVVYNSRGRGWSSIGWFSTGYAFEEYLKAKAKLHGLAIEGHALKDTRGDFLRFKALLGGRRPQNSSPGGDSAVGIFALTSGDDAPEAVALGVYPSTGRFADSSASQLFGANERTGGTRKPSPRYLSVPFHGYVDETVAGKVAKADSSWKDAVFTEARRADLFTLKPPVA